MQYGESRKTSRLSAYVKVHDGESRENDFKMQGIAEIQEDNIIWN